MGVKIKTKLNKFPEMQSRIDNLNGKKINVGVAGENGWLAGIHEYGCKITITPKMRAWLRANGLPVRASTTHITIPERSFLRSGFDNCHNEVSKKIEKFLALAIDGKMSEQEFLNTTGTLFRDRIKDYAVSVNTPPNHPFTIERKGSSNPLVDTGDMINSISYEVK